MADPLLNLPPFKLRFFGPQFWPTWLGLGLLWLLSHLPHRWRRRLGYRLGTLLLAQNRKRCHIVKTNLALALPELPPPHAAQLMRQSFGFGGQLMLDLGLIWWHSATAVQNQIDIQGLEHLQQLSQQQRPIIAVTAHFHAIDWGGLPFSRYCRRSAYFAKYTRNPLLNWLLMRGRSRFGARLITRNEPLRPLIRALKQRQLDLVYMVVDEDLGQKGSLFAPWFGTPKATLTTPVKLAKLTGAAILPCHCWFAPERGRYLLEIQPPLNGLQLEDELAAVSGINHSLEAMVRRHPEHYFWSLRYYQTRPDGSPSPYSSGIEGGR